LTLILRPRRVLVYETISEADHGLDLASRLAQLPAEPAHVNVHAERLGDVVVGAELEPVDGVRLRR
jgi:hypothetical protein